MKCTLTKIKRDETLDGGLRTDVIEGVTPKVPAVGFSFVMFAEPLENMDAAFRHVNTSIVEDVEHQGNHYRFTTRSGSIYELDVSEE